MLNPDRLTPETSETLTSPQARQFQISLILRPGYPLRWLFARARTAGNNGAGAGVPSLATLAARVHQELLLRQLSNLQARADAVGGSGGAQAGDGAAPQQQQRAQGHSDGQLSATSTGLLSRLSSLSRASVSRLSLARISRSLARASGSHAVVTSSPSASAGAGAGAAGAAGSAPAQPGSPTQSVAAAGAAHPRGQPPTTSTIHEAEASEVEVEEVAVSVAGPGDAPISHTQAAAAAAAASHLAAAGHLATAAEASAGSSASQLSSAVSADEGDGGKAGGGAGGAVATGAGQGKAAPGQQEVPSGKSFRDRVARPLSVQLSDLSDGDFDFLGSPALPGPPLPRMEELSGSLPHGSGPHGCHNHDAGNSHAGGGSQAHATATAPADVTAQESNPSARVLATPVPGMEATSLTGAPPHTEVVGEARPLQQLAGNSGPIIAAPAANAGAGGGSSSRLRRVGNSQCNLAAASITSTGSQADRSMLARASVRASNATVVGAGAGGGSEKVTPRKQSFVARALAAGSCDGGCDGCDGEAVTPAGTILCEICFEDAPSLQAVRMAPCKHCLCAACAFKLCDKAMAARPVQCPFCRAPIKAWARI